MACVSPGGTHGMAYGVGTACAVVRKEEMFLHRGQCMVVELNP
jgi:hypothetical protein